MKKDKINIPVANIQSLTTHYDVGDYSLSLLSEANGMTLLVSKDGQVFWVKRLVDKVQLISLNKGTNVMELIKPIKQN